MSNFYEDDLYDPDDVFLGSPPLRPVRTHLSPSPSPPLLKDVRYDQFEDEADPDGWPFGQLELEREDNDGFDDEVQKEIEVLQEANQELTVTDIAAFDADTLRQSALGSAQNPRIPSITTLYHDTEAAATLNSKFPDSPPERPPPHFVAHGPSRPSPPGDTFRRQPPSPGSWRGQQFYINDMHRRPSQTDGYQYISADDYFSSSDPETPSTDQSGSTPPAISIDRMAIAGITNPQIGGFVCTYPGCTAQPFQTQYLLNSHCNVHSSKTPHYCSVKGCPRSEGRKGFRRKGELIRHGLIHDSPGYVCPFCPDREHKYPRPDNLQRLVFSYRIIYHYGCR
jgi:hypothetical protein